MRAPDRLPEANIEMLLEIHGRMPESQTALAVGQAGAEVLRDAIERLKPPEDAPREQQLPYLVLTTCFVKGATLYQAAARLQLSQRQLSRERARAIALVTAELQVGTPSPPPAPAPYNAEPIPTIRGFIEREGEMRRIREALETKRFVRLHGPPGIGKTSLVAAIAADAAKTHPVFWYRVREEVNDSLPALTFELGQYLSAKGFTELAHYMETALSAANGSIATRLALKGLAAEPHLLVIDDHHLVEDDRAIRGLLDEIASRLTNVRIVTVGKHRYLPLPNAETIEVAPFSRLESRNFLARLGVECSAHMAHTLHSWTKGNPHLLKLAASWLRSSNDEEVAAGVASFQHEEEVQRFLLSNVTELLDSQDRAVLEAASIFRDRFIDDEVAYVSGLTRGAVLDASVRLSRYYVATRSKDGGTAFFHTSVREHVYERLDPERKSELHLRAAAWYRRTKDSKEAGYHQQRAMEALEEVG